MFLIDGAKVIKKYELRVTNDEKNRLSFYEAAYFYTELYR